MMIVDVADKNILKEGLKTYGRGPSITMVESLNKTNLDWHNSVNPEAKLSSPRS